MGGGDRQRRAATTTRQGFFPDGSRSFEEIDRLSIGVDGKVNLIGGRAEVDFYRVAPPGGFTKGLAGRASAPTSARATSPPERLGRDFFAYKPFHLAKSPPRPVARQDHQRRAGDPVVGQIRRRDLDAGQPAGRGDRLLVQPADRHAACRSPATPRSARRARSATTARPISSIPSPTSSRASGPTARAATAPASSSSRSSSSSPRARSPRSMRGPGGYVATGGHGGILGQVTHARRALPDVCAGLPAHGRFRRQHHAAAELGARRRSSARTAPRQRRHRRSRTSRAGCCPTPSRSSRSSRTAAIAADAFGDDPGDRG